MVGRWENTTLNPIRTKFESAYKIMLIPQPTFLAQALQGLDKTFLIFSNANAFQFFIKNNKITRRIFLKTYKAVLG
jgi:hypothetical protein